MPIGIDYAFHKKVVKNKEIEAALNYSLTHPREKVGSVENLFHLARIVYFCELVLLLSMILYVIVEVFYVFVDCVCVMPSHRQHVVSCSLDPCFADSASGAQPPVHGK